MLDVTEKLENSPCPLGCATSDRFVLEACDRLFGMPGRFRIVRCAQCGLLRTNPRPTPAAMGAYYPDNYGPYQQDAMPVASGKEPRAGLKRFLGMTPRMLPDVRPGQVLEVGCASGAFLERMRQAGWIAQGIEFSEAAANKARAKGFEVQTGAIEQAQAPRDPVDMVAAWMVLEHLHDPILALRRMRQWIKPDGYLVASVPDAGALDRRVFGEYWYGLHIPNHLFHYTPRTIRQVMSAAGWKVERIHWQRNCNNLLASMEFVARERKSERLLNGVHWLQNSARAGKIRALLSWLLGATRQSGRMEIWARPG